MVTVHNKCNPLDPPLALLRLADLLRDFLKLPHQDRQLRMHHFPTNLNAPNAACMVILFIPLMNLI